MKAISVYWNVQRTSRRRENPLASIAHPMITIGSERMAVELRKMKSKAYESYLRREVRTSVQDPKDAPLERVESSSYPDAHAGGSLNELWADKVSVLIFMTHKFILF